jgi:hypothetical protein
LEILDGEHDRAVANALEALRDLRILLVVIRKF